VSEENMAEGVSRRSVIKKGAIAGGAVIWAAPVVQSFASPAGAQGRGTVCTGVTCGPFTFGGVTVNLRCTPADENARACLCCCAGNTPDCAGCTPEPGETPCDADVVCVVVPNC
jgi:hypothetical protein